MIAEGDSAAAEETTEEEAVQPTVSPESLVKHSGGNALFGDEFEIIPDSRLRHLDKGPVKAYTARRLRDNENHYYAAICEKHLIPRAWQGATIAGIANSSLVRLVASGPVYWPPDKAQRYTFIFENKLGLPLIHSLEEQEGLGMKPDIAMNSVIRPLINVLQDFKELDLVHGNIHPGNIFDAGKNPIERVILGECLSTPPAYLQPVLFQPLERAIIDPIGRGMPHFGDDQYAFGASIAVILRTYDPMKGMSDEEIIKHKLDVGSYMAMVGKSRFTGAVLELLRGLLVDDRNLRWGLEETLSWLEGQRQSPKQVRKNIKASRPFIFNDQRYFTAESLAMVLDQNQEMAVKLIEEGDLQLWIERSLEDKLTKERLDLAIESVQEFSRGAGYWDSLLGRVAVALSPDSPVRIDGKKLHPEGIPYALAEAFVLKNNLQPFVDIINQKLVMFWLNTQPDMRIDIGAFSAKYDSCTAFLRQSDVMGYGIERCLYYLSPGCPCLSDKLKDYYARTPEDVLYAFEEISKSSKRPALFLDRHVVAFLSVKERQVIDPYLTELKSEEYFLRVMANIKCMATIQKRLRTEKVPGISDWMVDMLEPVYERFHDRLLRQSLRKKIEKLRDMGDLSRIAGIMDNPETIHMDMTGFRQAMRDYHSLREEQDKIEIKLETEDSFSTTIGREVAAIFSAVLSGIIIFGLVFVYFFTGKTF